MKERLFVKENIKRAELEEFLDKEFNRAGYSHCDIQRTPLSTRITVFAQRPGMVIGRGGKIIESTTQILKNKFNIENPQLDVQEISNPNLDPTIVVKQIASSIERGFNYKRVCILTIERIMRSGATGVAIRAGGKLGGDKSRFEKFSAGYLKYSGDTARTLVRISYGRAQVKLGTIGLQVRIMTQKPKELMILEEIDKSIKHNIAEDKDVEKEVEKMNAEEKANSEEVVSEQIKEMKDKQGDDKELNITEEVKEDIKEVVEEAKDVVKTVVEKIGEDVAKVAEKIKEEMENVEGKADEAKIENATSEENSKSEEKKDDEKKVEETKE